MATESAPTRYMQIGEVSERTGLTQRTLRYYESIGLLEPATRMEGGFRLYSEPDLRRLEQIVQLKQLLGFSLAEIRQIVEADELLQQIMIENKQDPDPAERRARMERAVDIISDQLRLIRTRIAAMGELEARYNRRLERLRGRITSLDVHLDAALGHTAPATPAVSAAPAAPPASSREESLAATGS
jgi:DNA-binding transcriptional MerR regulator